MRVFHWCAVERLRIGDWQGRDTDAEGNCRFRLQASVLAGTTDASSMEEVLFFWPTTDILEDVAFRPASSAAATSAIHPTKHGRLHDATEPEKSAPNAAEILAKCTSATASSALEEDCGALDAIEMDSALLLEWRALTATYDLDKIICLLRFILSAAKEGGSDRWSRVIQASCRGFVLPSSASDSGNSSSLNRAQAANLIRLCGGGGSIVHQACADLAATALFGPASSGDASKRAAAATPAAALPVSACDVLISSVSLDAANRLQAATAILSIAGRAAGSQLCNALTTPRVPALVAACCRLCKDDSAACGPVASFAQALAAAASAVVAFPAAITSIASAARAALGSQRADGRVRDAVQMAMQVLAERHGSALASATLRQMQAASG